MKNNSIMLAAINARYSHASLGSRFLLANMGRLRAQTTFLECNINEAPDTIVQRIVEQRPVIFGLGIYIWNRPQAERLIKDVRRLLPGVKIVLGGPEISYDADSDLGRSADCVIRGEGETLWPSICLDYMEGRPVPRLPALLPPTLADVALPDAEYSVDDLRHRNIYIEASRGCPFACDFCLSSVEAGVRHFEEPAVYTSLQRLIDRGGRQFRFVDRSFNMGGCRAERLLEFFIDRWQPDMRLHLEITPDGVSRPLRELLCRFPAGGLHIETGIQSFNADVLARINRWCDSEAVAEGIAWLVNVAHADVHADLIAGLPGETRESFAAGFDRLYSLGPGEIQVGILKNLHGTPLKRHCAAFGMRFREQPPYDVLETSTASTAELDEIRRFASHWERVVNRGHHPLSVSRMLSDCDSPWQRFDAFSRQLAERHGFYGFGLVETARMLLAFLTDECEVSPLEARALLRADYLFGGRRINLPAFLR